MITFFFKIVNDFNDEKKNDKKDDDENFHPEAFIVVRVILQSTTRVCK